MKAEPAAYEKIGEEKTVELDVIPPRIFKRQIIRPKYRRKDKRAQPYSWVADGKAILERINRARTLLNKPIYMSGH